MYRNKACKTSFLTFEENIQNLMSPFPVLETPRLILRDMRMEDAAAIFKMRADVRVSEFISRQPASELTEAQELVKRVITAWENKQTIAWVATRKNSKDREMIGACGFNRIDFLNHRAEIGGEMAVNHWGKFFAIEAVKAIIDFGFNQMKFHSLEAKVSPDNRSAIYLLEKLGFVKEAHFHDFYFFEGGYHDLAVYSKVNPSDQKK